MMMSFVGVKGQMRSNIVNYVPWLQTWSTEVKCGNPYVWLPHLVRCMIIQVYDDDDLHEG